MHINNPISYHTAEIAKKGKATVAVTIILAMTLSQCKLLVISQSWDNWQIIKLENTNLLGSVLLLNIIQWLCYSLVIIISKANSNNLIGCCIAQKAMSSLTTVAVAIIFGMPLSQCKLLTVSHSWDNQQKTYKFIRGCITPCDHLTIIFRSSYVHLTIIQWSSHLHLATISWSCYENLMKILWKSHDNCMSILKFNNNYLTNIIW